MPKKPLTVVDADSILSAFQKDWRDQLTEEECPVAVFVMVLLDSGKYVAKAHPREERIFRGIAVSLREYIKENMHEAASEVNPGHSIH